MNHTWLQITLLSCQIALAVTFPRCLTGQVAAPNSCGITMTRIPHGQFEMGAIDIAKFRTLAERITSAEDRLDLIGMMPPQRSVTVENDFEMSAHEISVGQFAQFVKATGYVTDAQKNQQGGTGKLPDGRFGHSREFNWKSVGFPLSDKHPVVNVSWNDAQAFCRCLSKTEGKRYRLPKEIEWEYACRAGSQTTFSGGDSIDDLKGLANVADASLLNVTPGLPWPAKFDDKFEYLAPVGSFKCNRFGLYDMHGNAGEWCEEKFTFLQPLGVEPEAESDLRTVRGGNWFNDPQRGGAACRSGAPQDLAMSLIGFRVVCEVAK